MGQLFSRTKVPQLEKLISSHVYRFVQLIRDNGPNVDLAVASRALEADIMSTFSFGKSIEAVDSWASGKELEMVAKNDLKATWMPVVSFLPLFRTLDADSGGFPSLPTFRFCASYSNNLRM
ncbi:hypothetical protein NW755_008673 [Fusarium falciforme]|uniref:Uncharacterized protein n=1 Tax=Fusarium falciforme TaxID=195108 RepID=A0A9W8R1R7_9HYPO|nr:hypothetical protein NW755_008673 [Fusarium falciforme]